MHHMKLHTHPIVRYVLNYDTHLEDTLGATGQCLQKPSRRDRYGRPATLHYRSYVPGGLSTIQSQELTIRLISVRDSQAV